MHASIPPPIGCCGVQTRALSPYGRGHIPTSPALQAHHLCASAPLGIGSARFSRHRYSLGRLLELLGIPQEGWTTPRQLRGAFVGFWDRGLVLSPALMPAAGPAVGRCKPHCSQSPLLTNGFPLLVYHGLFSATARVCGQQDSREQLCQGSLHVPKEVVVPIPCSPALHLGSVSLISRSSFSRW